jgi:hypothetical protein
MANGVLCSCGYQEADHEGGMAAQFDGNLKAMAKVHPKLVNCKGYEPVESHGWKKI